MPRSQSCLDAQNLGILPRNDELCMVSLGVAELSCASSPQVLSQRAWRGVQQRPARFTAWHKCHTWCKFPSHDHSVGARQARFLRLAGTHGGCRWANHQQEGQRLRLVSNHNLLTHCRPCYTYKVISLAAVLLPCRTSRRFRCCDSSAGNSSCEHSQTTTACDSV